MMREFLSSMLPRHDLSIFLLFYFSLCCGDDKSYQQLKPEFGHIASSSNMEVLRKPDIILAPLDMNRKIHRVRGKSKMETTVRLIEI